MHFRICLFNTVCNLLVTVVVAFTLRTAHASSSDHQVFTKSVQLYNQKQFEKSRDLLLRLVKKDRTNEKYWLMLGHASLMLGHFRNAEMCYSRVLLRKGPLGNQAKLYKAKSVRLSGATPKAIGLFKEILADPQIPAPLKEMASRELLAIGKSRAPASEELTRKQALELFRQQNHEKTVSLVDQQISPSEDLLLLKSMALVKLNRPSEARELLESLRDRSANKGRIDSVRGSLFPQEKLEEEKQFWLFVDLSVGRDSNIYLAPESTAPQAENLYKIGVGLGGILWSNGTWSSTLNYAGSLDEVANAPELQSVNHSVQADLSYDHGFFSFKMGPYFQQELWAGARAISREGARLRLRVSSEGLNAGFTADLAQLKTPLDSRPDLQGQSSEARVHIGYFGSTLSGQLYTDQAIHKTGDLLYTDASLIPVAHSASTFGARVAWQMSDNWALSLSGSQKLRTFSELAQPGAKERKDEVTTLSFRVTHYWSSQLSLFLSGSSLQSVSTLGPGDVKDANFSGTTIMTGLSWDVF